MATLNLASVGSTFPNIDYHSYSAAIAKDSTISINLFTTDIYLGVDAIDNADTKFMAVHILNVDGTQYTGNSYLEITSNTTLTLRGAALTTSQKIIAMIADNTTY